ncbi:MAG: hypothetical protein ACREYF_19415 [Gammaproteobacteria bacterium]
MPISTFYARYRLMLRDENNSGYARNYPETVPLEKGRVYTRKRRRPEVRSSAHLERLMSLTLGMNPASRKAYTTSRKFLLLIFMSDFTAAEATVLSH